MDYREYDELLLISLARISFLNLAEKINLLKKLDSHIDLALLSIEEIQQISKRKLKANWNGKRNLQEACRELKIIKDKGIGYLLYNQAEYPALLRETSNAPFMLFYRGNPAVLCEKTVSVVGTRRITPEGRRAAFEFSKDAVKAGCTVVSGLAYGTDSFCHEGAVSGAFDVMESGSSDYFGKTVAVLPAGCDTVVPGGNRKLAEKILQTGGCIISEYVPGVPSEPWRFVQRNRIIAALSPAVVVIQAPTGSGALITADFALSYNRDVLFHSACFTENAMKINRMVTESLKAEYSRQKVSEFKITNSVQKYVDSGAPVICDYEDYCRCLKEIPGSRSEKIVQLNLFEGF